MHRTKPDGRTNAKRVWLLTDQAKSELQLCPPALPQGLGIAAIHDYVDHRTQFWLQAKATYKH